MDYLGYASSQWEMMLQCNGHLSLAGRIHKILLVNVLFFYSILARLRLWFLINFNISAMHGLHMLSSDMNDILYIIPTGIEMKETKGEMKSFAFIYNRFRVSRLK